ncbi:class I SAM-dependent methyltransferase [Streptomyces sp. MST-110588]|uniref:methyltransferase n=1 Tax=Streptomyces sp. MST-110588 TaxID=2833628 RepID=UPI001F5C935F|nr:class I SAM-dependent methyltransferase [Streptomyces sp. MST-110588]UNO42297.1 class I SAM-dependent methyltransferase [Streptomyces sp. MST-110588]
MNSPAVVEWIEADQARSARWRSESGAPPPRRVVVADDRMKADAAYKLACEGTALLWRGDFHNARQLLTALARRIDRRPRKQPPADPARAFHLHRAAQSQRARILGMLLVPLDPGYVVPLHRAPDVRQACAQAYGTEGGHGTGDGERHGDGAGNGDGAEQASGGGQEAALVSLRELLGLIGAYEWRKKGVEIPALGGDRVHPYYGVFSPVRGEYVDLVARAPLPATDPAIAFDIGTGTGVLAAVLARRGVRRIVATDQDPRALACARENAGRLGVAGQVEVVRADLFPAGRAPLVVCNPPWVPAKPTSPVEYAVYDPGSRMLRGFLDGLADHLEPGGEGWLILSDLAEHLGLRPRAELLSAFESAGLTVRDRLDIAPRHPRARDTSDPLHAARAAEVTSLWRLGAAAG